MIPFEKRVDPRGKTLLLVSWRSCTRCRTTGTSPSSGGCAADVQAIRDKYISVTPLQYNLTDPAGVYSLQRNSGRAPTF
jgi:5'-nucleotidase